MFVKGGANQLIVPPFFLHYYHKIFCFFITIHYICLIVVFIFGKRG